ncbi:hypothetical protein Trydic_g11323 [Trypoxylus dichotomus]
MEKDFAECQRKIFFSEYRHLNNMVVELQKCNQELLNENKRLRKNFNSLSEQMQNNLNKSLDDENTHLLYINIKEKYQFLLKESENLKQEKEILMKHYEEKILHYKNEVEKEKTNVELKEIEFSEKCQVHQASIALQNDELEAKWQARLDIVNQQLKDSNMTCNIFRNQLVDMKNRFSFNNTESDKRIQELEQTLAMAEEKLRRTQEKLLTNQQLGVHTYRGGNKLNVYKKNRPYTYAIGARTANHSFHGDELPSNPKR